MPPTPRFPTIEERVLAYWAKDGTFLASVEARDGGTDGSNEFVFYDGPPFANGLPHYGHLLTGYVTVSYTHLDVYKRQEVFLAKEGHEGLVGINFLRKIELPLPATLYGCLLYTSRCV